MWYVSKTCCVSVSTSMILPSSSPAKQTTLPLLINSMGKDLTSRLGSKGYSMDYFYSDSIWGSFFYF